MNLQLVKRVVFAAGLAYLSIYALLGKLGKGRNLQGAQLVRGATCKGRNL